MKDFMYNFSEDEAEESYPDFFIEWDKAVSEGKKPGFYEPEELTEIIEIYIVDNQIKRAKQAINYALRIYSEDEEILYEILLMLSDYERWNELFVICERYKNDCDVWVDGHRLTALLHLGMEDEAFLLFKKTKTIYAEEADNLSILYQAMGEALCEMDLFDSSIEVMQEAINTLGMNIDFYWQQMICYISMECKVKVLEVAEIIQKLDPLNAATWFRLGIAFQDIDDSERAIEAFEYAQSLGDDSEEILMNMIYTYDKNKNFSKALEKAAQYLNLHPDSYVITMMAAKLSSMLENWSEAVKYVDGALRITPEVTSLYLYKSNFLLQLQEYKKAKLALIEGLEKTKDLQGSLAKKLKKLNKQYPDY